jgi:PAS domain S-box-containing protein
MHPFRGEASGPSPELRLIYEAAPIGLAFLTPDCRYVLINRHLTEICGISIADHIGRSVRETVPQVADQVEEIVRTVVRSGEPITGIEVNGQRPDKKNAERIWMTYWHPLKNRDGGIVGINVVSEEITERKRAETALATSQERFRELADNMSQFAWTADPTGRRMWFNNRWYDYTGTTFEEMRGWGWQKVHHPDHVARVVNRIRESCKTGTPWEDTFPLRGADGSYRWFLTGAVPIRDETGEVVRWFGTGTDVTRQIEAERAVRKLNETLSERVKAQVRERDRIWNVSQDLLVAADTEGRIVSVNPAWTETLGWAEDDLLGKTGEWLIHPDDLEKSTKERTSLVEGQKIQHFENRIRHKDGSYRWLSWRAVPDQDLIFAVGRDVTDLRHAKEQLRMSRRELARVSRQTTMGAMTASIAHEVKQPLAAVLMNANAGLQWLKRSEPNLDEVRAALDRIVSDSHRANEVIASVRSIFGKDRRDKILVNVNTLIGEVLVLIQEELESHQVSLRSELIEGIPEVMAERMQLQQVLLNLVTNAVDAMSSVTGRERRLTVKSKVHDLQSVVIAVEDSGTGIDPRHVDRIFDSFFTTKPDGMGMGLSICRSIIESHGGRLWFSPCSPHGTTFYVQLPAEVRNDV